MKRRFPAFVLCLLLICSVFIPISLGGNVKNIPHQPVSNSRGNILYVGGSGGDNYTTIQDAIDNASDGDTVFLYDDSSPYYELLVVDKSIILIGEDRNTTVIDGNNGGDVVFITADMVSVSGFTIQYSGGDSNNRYCGIEICANNCIIFGNIINHNYYGISIDNSFNNIIEDNEILNNEDKSISIIRSNYTIINNNNIQNAYVHVYRSNNNHIIDNSILNGCIYLDYNSDENKIIGNNISNLNSYAIIIDFYSSYNLVKLNNISNNKIGIFLDSDYNTITENIITKSQKGIHLGSTKESIISKNAISDNNIGIKFGDNGTAVDNIISSNIISNNEYGIKSDSIQNTFSYDNEISNNNLIDNNYNAYDSLSLGTLILFGDKNSWDNNYYSDYKGGLVYIIPCILWVYMFIPFPFFNIDWRPAKEPYDIEV